MGFFAGSGCNFKENPTEAGGGPFCGSDCNTPAPTPAPTILQMTVIQENGQCLESDGTLSDGSSENVYMISFLQIF